MGGIQKGSFTVGDFLLHLLYYYLHMLYYYHMLFKKIEFLSFKFLTGSFFSGGHFPGGIFPGEYFWTLIDTSLQPDIQLKDSKDSEDSNNVCFQV